MAVVTELAKEIAVRLKAGDPAAGQIGRLQTLVSTLLHQARAAGELPADARTELAVLFDRVRAAVATGDEWLARMEPELLALQARQRLRRAYGVS